MRRRKGHALRRRYGRAMSLAEQAREHLAHPPRMRESSGGYYIEHYSPVRHGYIPASDVMSLARAEEDLRHAAGAYR